MGAMSILSLLLIPASSDATWLVSAFILLFRLLDMTVVSAVFIIAKFVCNMFIYVCMAACLSTNVPSNLMV